MGLKVLSEEPSQIRARDGQLYSVHDFGLSPVVVDSVDVDAVRENFQDLFSGVWAGRLENDGFNRLVLAAGLNPRQIVTLRAYCKYMLQIGTPFSQAYVEQTLTSNPGLAGDLANLFDARFDPAHGSSSDAQQNGIEGRIADQLNQVASLDQDRILRRYLELIKATLRTNAWQRDRATVWPRTTCPTSSTRARSRACRRRGRLRDLRLCALCRGRPSARRQGGARRAALVRSAGGFPYRGPGPDEGADGQECGHRPGGRQGRLRASSARRPAATGRLLEEGIRCYKTFLRGLLDITDNQDPSGRRPPG